MALLTLTNCKKHDDGTRGVNEIWLHNKRIDPFQTTIAVGTTIIFINKDNMTHQLSETNNLFSSKLQSGDKYTYTFNTAGIYNIYCAIHNSMTGAIKVQ